VSALRAGPISVVDLALVIDRAPETTSQHLRVLRELGVVEGERRGHRVYYRLRDAGTPARFVRLLEDLERSA
jgi:ArsR family transcriptional regulator